jgi:hypothetical protein
MERLLLDPTDPQYIGGRLQFYTALYEDYLAFPESLRAGRVWPRSEHDPWLLEALKNMTRPDAVVLTNHVLPQAPETLARLEDGGAMLEIGPGRIRSNSRCRAISDCLRGGSGVRRAPC